MTTVVLSPSLGRSNAPVALPASTESHPMGVSIDSAKEAALGTDADSPTSSAANLLSLGHGHDDVQLHGEPEAERLDIDKETVMENGPTLVDGVSIERVADAAVAPRPCNKRRRVVFECADIVEFEPTVYTTSITSGGVPVGLSLNERSRSRRRLDSFEMERADEYVAAAASRAEDEWEGAYVETGNGTDTCTDFYDMTRFFMIRRVGRQNYMEEGYLDPQEREMILNNAGCGEPVIASVEAEVNAIIQHRRESNEVDYSFMYVVEDEDEEEDAEDEEGDAEDDEEEEEEEQVDVVNVMTDAQHGAGAGDLQDASEKERENIAEDDIAKTHNDMIDQEVEMEVSEPTVHQCSNDDPEAASM